MRTQGAPSRSGESLLREDRLRRRADFQRCYEQGRRHRGKLATLFFVERERGAPGPRLGITVTRKVGNSVVRHRIKRRVREIYRRWGQRNLLPPYDVVVHIRPSAQMADFKSLRQEMLRLLTPLIRNDHQA